MISIQVEVDITKEVKSIKHNCYEYNTRAEKNNLNSRIQYNEEKNELYLGRTEQLEYGTYKCKLADTLDTCIAVSDSMSKQICFEYGE